MGTATDITRAVVAVGIITDGAAAADTITAGATAATKDWLRSPDAAFSDPLPR